MPRLVALADSSADLFTGMGSYCWDVEADILYWSSGLLRVYRLSAAPEGEHGFYALLHHEDRVRVEAETTGFLQSGDKYDHRFRIICPDGSVRTILDRGIIERHPNGAAKLLRGINIDITEELADAKPAAADDPHATFQLLADNIDQFAWIANASGWIYWYNKRWMDYTGLTLEAMAGWGWRKVHHPDHVDRVVEKITRCFETGQPWQDEFPIRDKSGAYRWFLSRALPVRDENGKILLWFGTNTDITEQRRSEAQVRALTESVPQLVWTASAEGKVEYYNSKIADYATARDLESGKWDWSLLVHPDDASGTETAWGASALEGTGYSHTHRLRMADGSYRWHISRGVPVKDASGRVEKLFGTATDIHELKEADLLREILLEESNHRIKNILTVIQSLAQLSMRGSDHASDPRFDVFVKRLHALSQAHTMTMRGGSTATRIFELVDSASNACGIGPERLTRSGVDTSVSSHAGQMLALALHELCTNAIKYGALKSDVGRVTIASELLPSGRVRLRWSESGGAPVVAPRTKGLGSRLIEQVLAKAINGVVKLQFEPSGLVCTIEGDFERSGRQPT